MSPSFLQLLFFPFSALDCALLFPAWCDQPRLPTVHPTVRPTGCAVQGISLHWQRHCTARRTNPVPPIHAQPRLALLELQRQVADVIGPDLRAAAAAVAEAESALEATSKRASALAAEQEAATEAEERGLAAGVPCGTPCWSECNLQCALKCAGSGADAAQWLKLALRAPAPVVLMAVACSRSVHRTKGALHKRVHCT